MIVQRMADGVPVGPPSRVALGDVIEREPGEHGDEASLDATAPAAESSSIEALLRFLRLSPPDADDAHLVAATVSDLADAGADPAAEMPAEAPIASPAIDATPLVTKQRQSVEPIDTTVGAPTAASVTHDVPRPAPGPSEPVRPRASPTSLETAAAAPIASAPPALAPAVVSPVSSVVAPPAVAVEAITSRPRASDPTAHVELTSEPAPAHTTRAAARERIAVARRGSDAPVLPRPAAAIRSNPPESAPDTARPAAARPALPPSQASAPVAAAPSLTADHHASRAAPDRSKVVTAKLAGVDPWRLAAPPHAPRAASLLPSSEPVVRSKPTAPISNMGATGTAAVEITVPVASTAHIARTAPVVSTPRSASAAPVARTAPVAGTAASAHPATSASTASVATSTASVATSTNPVAANAAPVTRSTLATPTAAASAGIAPVAAHLPPVIRIAPIAHVAPTASVAPIANTATLAARRPLASIAPGANITPAAAVVPDGIRMSSPATSPAIAPVATVVPRASESVDRPSPSTRAATQEINRETRIGDIVVELGEPLSTPKAVEHAGSLLAVIPRPSFRPRRRL
ncbi:MAG: hypothetical protein ABIY55_13705 [Kofleriaceae bacterium]